jgi:hypothetical protein
MLIWPLRRAFHLDESRPRTGFECDEVGVAERPGGTAHPPVLVLKEAPYGALTLDAAAHAQNLAVPHSRQLPPSLRHTSHARYVCILGDARSGLTVPPTLRHVDHRNWYAPKYPFPVLIAHRSRDSCQRIHAASRSHHDGYVRVILVWRA